MNLFLKFIPLFNISRSLLLFYQVSQAYIYNTKNETYLANSKHIIMSFNHRNLVKKDEINLSIYHWLIWNNNRIFYRYWIVTNKEIILFGGDSMRTMSSFALYLSYHVIRVQGNLIKVVHEVLAGRLCLVHSLSMEQ